MSANKKPERGPKKIIDLHTHHEPFVTTSDLALYWRVSRKQIYKQIEAGTLHAIRFGPRLLRIRTAEAVRFEENAKMGGRDDEPHGRDKESARSSEPQPTGRAGRAEAADAPTSQRGGKSRG